MSERTEPRAEEGCELQPVTCWPLVYSACAVVTLGVVVALGLFVFDWLRPLMQAEETPVTQMKPVDEPVSHIDRGPDLPGTTPSDARVVTVSRVVVVREYVPLPPVAAVKREEWTVPVERLARKPRPDSPKARHSFEKPPRPVVQSEKKLLESLVTASRELDLETHKGTGKTLLAVGKKLLQEQQDKKKKDENPGSDLSSFMVKLLKERDDLRGLPLLAGKACQTSREESEVLGTVSRNVRPRQRFGSEGSKALVAEVNKQIAAHETTPQMLVKPLEQMLQTEGRLVRLELVRMLGMIKGKKSTQALARRAVFDLDDDVRELAVGQLRARSVDDARPIFLSAFRHPWAPAADHAAVALVALDDNGAVEELKKIVDENDPTTPFKEEGIYRQRQLVRVNHLRNCLLCHPPSINEKDLVSGPIPTPGQSLPTVYYQKRRDQTTPFVRADVVYFRQDFSSVHEVEKPNKWPALQRFDYLVQVRELTEEEAAKALEDLKKQKTNSRREAARWVLWKLTHPVHDRSRSVE